jgi:hypothetical protein
MATIGCGCGISRKDTHLYMHPYEISYDSDITNYIRIPRDRLSLKLLLETHSFAVSEDEACKRELITFVPL